MPAKGPLPDSSSATVGCYHCGLPLPPGEPFRQEVFGSARSFCCPGCLEVCRTIVATGLGEYYRLRSGFDAPAAPTPPPPLPAELALYDRPELQRGFARGDARTREVSLVLEAIRCPACLWLSERRLRQLDGVIDAQLDYESERAVVRWDPARIQLSAILGAIADLGYTAYPYDPQHRDELARDQQQRSSDRLIFAAFLGALLMHFAVATYLLGIDGEAPLPLWVAFGRWGSLLAAGALLAYSGSEFFAGAWRDLRHGRAGMDVPIALGLSVAFFASAWATVARHGEVYFDSIGMFVFFVLLARRYELRGRAQAAAMLDRLARVVPHTARRQDEDGRLHDVFSMDLQPGDRVLVRPGETVPADGVIVEGESRFEEALLTGESRPVERGVGGRLLGGAVNGNQPVLMEVLQRSDESTLNWVHRLLRQALREKPRAALVAERIAAWFIAAVLLLAVLTATLWSLADPSRMIPATIAVLIVTCPCALALATPVALSVAAGEFLRRGVLPLRMRAVEALAQGGVVVFDKTGALTFARPRLATVDLPGQLDEGAARRYAAALEQASEHPLARAFREQLPRSSREPMNAPLPEVRQRANHPGQGVEGWIDGECWRLGTPAYVLALAQGDGAAFDATDGADAVAVLGNRRGIQARFGFVDTLRPEAVEAVQALREQGLRRVVILSGDDAPRVARVAQGLGISEWHGGLSPDAKLAWVQREQQRGNRIVMIGDGLNDAPTLAAANASIACAEGAELAQFNSDFLLLDADLRAIPAGYALARSTRRTVMQNLAWAAGYNFLAVPAAALGLIPPWAAAIGMSLSSLLVVGNSLRLKKAIHRTGSRQPGTP